MIPDPQNLSERLLRPLRLKYVHFNPTNALVDWALPNADFGVGKHLNRDLPWPRGLLGRRDHRRHHHRRRLVRH